MRNLIKYLIPAFLLAAPIALPAQAQTYPTRPVHVVVPFPPGGFTDVTARLIAQKLGEALGQQMVIENRSGASGLLGVEAVTKAVPDGYTLLITTGDFIETPSLMPKMGFDPNKDLLPVAMIASAPLLLGAQAGGPIGSVMDLIAQAKARPGQIAFSSPGTGTINHLAVEWLAIEAGLKLIHVPYRGGAPAATAIAAGDVPVGAVTISSAQSLMDAGKIKPIALMTRERPSFAPADWPTLSEMGFPVDAALWVGLFVPARTPPAIVARLDAALARLLHDATVRKRLNELGTEAAAISGSAFADRIRLDAAHYAKIIEQTGIHVEH
ncbi:MAG TPA: tripartite tricarboxylate transporter substrate-binding protein [Xanthobacteraceae bacterium]|jgi:tripartite-type tricarboxylate transporter receptor subunit TctC